MERLATFTKAQLVAIIATGVDFATTWVLAYKLQLPKLMSSAIGTSLGGVTSFLLSRVWAFNAKAGNWKAQLMRFAPVWAGNLALNFWGIALLKYWTGDDNFMLKKMIIAIGVAVFYNYVLQKRFVFK